MHDSVMRDAIQLTSAYCEFSSIVHICQPVPLLGGPITKRRLEWFTIPPENGKFVRLVTILRIFLFSLLVHILSVWNLSHNEGIEFVTLKVACLALYSCPIYMEPPPLREI